MNDPSSDAVPRSCAEQGMQGRLGIVVIGRNEGERLQRCLASVSSSSQHVVYVDSGSTDDSLDIAGRFNAQVVALDATVPFTAARARNRGWHRLLESCPNLNYVQFVDGDCEVLQGWLATAVGFLDGHTDTAAVTGRNHERHPERSIYNLLCEMEWRNGAAGPTRACGGNAMMRTVALRQSGGFCESLIAGEEPELCVRMRAAGWTIWQLDEPMTLHDAAMTRFLQWWKRTMRAGFSYAQGKALHGSPPERLWVRESRSAWLWGLGLPLFLLVAAAGVSPWLLLGFLMYPLQVVRLFLLTRGSARARIARASFLVLGKFPEVVGQLKFLVHRLAGSSGRLIEYK